ncbi:MAG: radical SAM protein [Bacteroidales bacterium]|nr:radical SAM protein [Bacteroidales bacterium]
MPTIIFKPTEACNSSCIYCDVVTRKAPKTMKTDLLELIFVRMDEYLKQEINERITLIWHGGEPLLLGADYFRKAIGFQQKYCAETSDRIEHAIQSNLTLLNQEFVDIFRSMGINQIGTSFEPIANIRGPGVKRDSEWYNRKFMQGLTCWQRIIWVGDLFMW